MFTPYYIFIIIKVEDNSFWDAYQMPKTVLSALDAFIRLTQKHCDMSLLQMRNRSFEGSNNLSQAIYPENKSEYELRSVRFQNLCL